MPFPKSKVQRGRRFPEDQPTGRASPPTSAPAARTSSRSSGASTGSARATRSPSRCRSTRSTSSTSPAASRSPRSPARPRAEGALPDRPDRPRVRGAGPSRLRDPRGARGRLPHGSAPHAAEHRAPGAPDPGAPHARPAHGGRRRRCGRYGRMPVQLVVWARLEIWCSKSARPLQAWRPRRSKISLKTIWRKINRRSICCFSLHSWV